MTEEKDDRENILTKCEVAEYMVIKQASAIIKLEQEALQGKERFQLYKSE